MLSISQSLPGLNATNMAILVGEKLRGALGSVAAIIGVCLPGAVIMYVVGMFYRSHGDHVWVTAALKGVAAAAVGLILSTVVGLSKKSLADRFDFVFSRQSPSVPWSAGSHSGCAGVFRANCCADVHRRTIVE
jgi:chromate transporter